MVEDLSKLNLLDEIRKCREELGGPFFSKRENLKLKKEQEQFRKDEDLRNSRRALNQPLTHNSEPSKKVEVEKIQPQRQKKQQTLQTKQDENEALLSRITRNPDSHGFAPEPNTSKSMSFNMPSSISQMNFSTRTSNRMEAHPPLQDHNDGKTEKFLDEKSDSQRKNKK